MAFNGCRTTLIIIGQSGAVVGILDDDPMWVQTTIPVSSAARSTGSQYRPAS